MTDAERKAVAEIKSWFAEITDPEAENLAQHILRTLASPTPAMIEAGVAARKGHGDEYLRTQRAFQAMLRAETRKPPSVERVQEIMRRAETREEQP